MSVKDEKSSADVAVSAPRARPAGQPERPLGSVVVQALSSSSATVIAVLIGCLWSIPTLGLFISSFRPASLISSTGWWTSLAPSWAFTIENYQQVLQAQGMGAAFLNSLIIAIPATILPTLVAAFAAYAFSWMRFPGRDWIFFSIVALMVVPLQITLAPLFSLFTTVGLTGQYASVWLAHTAFGLPFAIYLLRNFFSALPSDLFESAHIDGAGSWTIFWKIIIPLSVPALASLTIFQFMWVWNDLLIALIFLGGNPDHAPMTVAIAGLVNSFGSNYQVLTSAAFVSMALPLIVFFSLQRYFIRGILAGSVKG
jgi:alpha-glucoside transport system permease protein